MVAPHEQLATLASLAHLEALVLHFGVYEGCPQVNRLHPTTLLSLPPSVTKLVLSKFSSCVPAVMLPEDISIVYKSHWFE